MFPAMIWVSRVVFSAKGIFPQEPGKTPDKQTIYQVYLMINQCRLYYVLSDREFNHNLPLYEYFLVFLFVYPFGFAYAAGEQVAMLFFSSIVKDLGLVVCCSLQAAKRRRLNNYLNDSRLFLLIFFYLVINIIVICLYTS